MGYTTFIDEAKVDLLAIQMTRSSTHAKPLDHDGARLAWSDILAEEWSFELVTPIDASSRRPL